MLENLDFNNFKDFESASNTVLEYLQKKVGYSLWMMTRTVDNDWIVLQVKDNYYNVKEGDIFKWCDSFCSKMVLGQGPFVAPNSDDVEIYKNAEIGKYVKIKSYFGIPINNTDGSLFGTLCAIDPNPQKESIKEFLPLVQIMGKLLSSMLVQDELNAKLNKQNLELSQNISLLDNNLKYIKVTNEGKIFEISNKFLNVTKLKKDFLLNKQYDEVFIKNKNFEYIKNKTETSSTYQEYFEGYTNKDEYYCLELDINKTINSQNGLKNFLITYKNITDQKEKEKLKIQMIEQYKLASMGEMIGNIAHQWRQPLSAIRAVSSSIKIKKQLNLIDDNELYEHLDIIDKNTIYLSDTINVFSNYLKHDRDTNTSSLQEILNESLEILNATLTNNNIAILKEFDSNEITTSTMKKLLPQVIINIVSNAKDAILDKKIDDAWIKISLKKIDEKAVIIIEDNAGGIKEEVINRIFEPYFTTKHSSVGTGLGLHICYRIITENLKGNIKVENSKFGAKFTIILDL